MDYPKPHMPEQAPPSRLARFGRRLLRWAGYALVFLLILALLAPLFYRWTTDGLFEQAMAEAERLDPGMVRWADLEKARAAVPDTENAALVILEAMKNQPDKAPARFDVPEDVPSYFYLGPTTTWKEVAAKISPNLMLPRSLAKKLQADVAATATACEKTKTVAAMRAGRVPGERDPVLLGARARIDDVFKVHGSIAQLHSPAALLAADEQRAAAGIDAIRRMLGVARAMGDEPGLMPNLARKDCGVLACETLERLLAQTSPTDADLAALQEDLARERREPLLLRALRGDRAWMAELYQATLEGKPTPLALADPTDLSSPGNQSPPGPLTRYALAGLWRENGALIVGHYTALIEAAKKPPSQATILIAQFDQEFWKRLDDSYSDFFVVQRYALVRLQLSKLAVYAASFARWQADVAAAEGAIACERFRLKHGRWPERADELTPDFVKEPLVDPFSGKPLRIAKRADGIVIYSVGKNGTDEGGQIRADPGSPFREWTNDVGLRLWNVKARRQPLNSAEPPPSAP